MPYSTAATRATATHSCAMHQCNSAVSDGCHSFRCEVDQDRYTVGCKLSYGICEMRWMTYGVSPCSSRASTSAPAGLATDRPRTHQRAIDEPSDGAMSCTVAWTLTGQLVLLLRRWAAGELEHRMVDVQVESTPSVRSASMQLTRPHCAAACSTDAPDASTACRSSAAPSSSAASAMIASVDPICI